MPRRSYIKFFLEIFEIEKKMEKMTVFITGSSGFICSNLAKRILTTEPDTKFIGLDNMNDYYKGVTIGQENRGKRKGTPVIGDNVRIGVNATIVGAIKIGNDILIVPNTYVNCDVPDHSIVFGNPCIIKHRDNATEGYIKRTI